MKKQKHGFWVFIFSLIPGAGEMYMGFKKQGISIMLLFWGSIALASITGLVWLAMFLPVICFYSFFNVHNLKSLSEEEFYSVEDNYILHMDQLSGDMGKFLQKHQSAAAWVLILLGICILWSRFTSLLYLIVPDHHCCRYHCCRYLSSYSAEKEAETGNRNKRRALLGTLSSISAADRKACSYF